MKRRTFRVVCVAWFIAAAVCSAGAAVAGDGVVAAVASAQMPMALWLLIDTRGRG